MRRGTKVAACITVGGLVIVLYGEKGLPCMFRG